MNKINLNNINFNGSSGGGSGTVKSVNNIQPDSEGNISLDIPTVDTTVTKEGTNAVKSSGIYSAIHPAYVTSIPASGADSNKAYRLGVITGAVVISLATPTDTTIDNYWHFTFTTDANIISVTWPLTMNGWVGNCLDNGSPKIVASKHYEINIDIEGYGFITEF